MTRTLPAIAILAVGAVLVVAGCGGSDSSSSAEGGAYGSGGETSSTQSAKSESSATGEGASAGAGAVAVAKNPKLGAILVDSKGFTLYDFHKDEGGKSACYGACASTWPPLTTGGAPQAMSGAKASMLGTAKRSDGTLQVTYAGHPLYTYVADTKPGIVKGNDFSSFGAQWYALKPSGEEAGD